MRSADQVHVVGLGEAGQCLLTKCVTNTSVVLFPVRVIFVGIRPEQITEETLVRDIGRSSDFTKLVQSVEVRAETTVHAQNFVVNECSDGQAVKHVNKLLPYFDRESSFAVIIKSIHSVDLSNLVVTSKEEEVLGVLYFKSEKQAESLNGVLSTVNVVTKEQVVSLRRHTAKLKKLQQVIELSVQVTYKK